MQRHTFLILLALYGAQLAASHNPESINISDVYTFGIVYHEQGVENVSHRIFHDYIIDTLPECVVANRSFEFKQINISHSPSITELNNLYKSLNNEENLLFIGGQDNFYIDLLIKRGINSSANLERLKKVPFHNILTFDAHNRVDAIYSISKELFQYDWHGFKEKGILIFGENAAELEVHDMRKVATLLRLSLTVFFYSIKKSKEVVAALLRVSEANQNFIVIANEEESVDLLKNAAEASLLTYSYRWIFFNSRIPFSHIEKTMYMHTNNLTTIEFGRRADIHKKLNTTMDVLLYDLLRAWSQVLPYVFDCNATVNPKFHEISGSGKIEINELNVTRKSWQLYIYSDINPANQTGYWIDDGTLKMHKPIKKDLHKHWVLKELQRTKLKLVTILDPPYVQYKSNYSEDEPVAEQLEGLAFDLMKTILDELDVTYTVTISPHGKYGRPFGVNALGALIWDGLMADMVSGKYDIAVAQITPTPDRLQYVQFSVPYQRYTLSILYKIEATDDLRRAFFFTVPFDMYLWLAVLGAVVATIFAMAIIDALNPNKHRYTFYESIFFAVGSIVQGLTLAPPDRPSGRVVVSFYWFFCIMMVIVYVCNFGAHLTIDRLRPREMNSLSDLLGQNLYSFGTVGSTNLETYFRKSQTDLGRSLYQRMEMSNGIVNNTFHALDKVNAGSYAFIYTDYLNHYFSGKNCGLKHVGSYDSFSINFAFKKNAEWSDILNDMIQAKLKTTNGEQSYITVLENTYIRTNGSFACPTDSLIAHLNTIFDLKKYMHFLPVITSDPDVLDIRYTMGIWLISIGGCIIALLVSVVEYVIERMLTTRHARNRKLQNKKVQERITKSANKYESYA